jgi:MATE family multidrug resistance protein
MRSDGVAWGSLLADYLGLMIAILLVARHLRQLPSYGLAWQGNRTTIRQLLGVNGYLFVRTLMLLFAHAFVTAQSAKIGGNTLAANALLLQYITLLAYFLDGVAFAAEASCGRHIGARDSTMFYRTVNAAAVFSLAMALAASFSFWILHDNLLKAMTNLPEVLSTAQQYVVWVIWIPVISVWSYLCDGIFVGSAQSQAMFHSVWTALLAMLSTWYIVGDSADNHHLWMAYWVFCLVRALVACWIYWRISVHQLWWQF